MEYLQQLFGLFSLLIIVLFQITGCNGEITAYSEGTYVKVNPMSGQIELSRYETSSSSDTDEVVSSNVVSSDVTTDSMNSTQSSAVDTTTVTTTTTAAPPSPSDLKKTVTVEFVNITEVDVEGNEIGSNDTSYQHSYSMFTSDNFTTTNLPLVSGLYGNLSAQMFTLDHSMTGIPATLKVHIYMIEEAGTVDMDGEMQTLSKGEIVLSTEVSDWQWCDNTNICSASNGTETGAALKFAMKFMGSGSISQDSETSQKYELGDGQHIFLSSKTQPGGQWSNMPSVFPQYVAHDSTFTFYLTKFSSNIIFDATVDIDMDEDGGNTVGSASQMDMLSTTVFLLMSLLMKMFF